VTVMMVPGHETEAARVALRAAVVALTTPEVLDVEREDGSLSTAVVPALLTQLAGEINGMEGVGSFTARSRPPLRLDAMQLLTDIDRVTGCRQAAGRLEAVHTWGQDCASGLAGEALLKASALAEDWLRSTRELLDPTPKRRAHGVPCPSCGATKVWSHEDADNHEHYARPALGIDETAAACICDACGARWGVELWAHLQQVLEQQKAEILAVERYDPVPRIRLPDRPVQCQGRIRDERVSRYRTRRCTALVDAEGYCRNAHLHEPTGEDS
jgi:hypothetical protein